VTEQIEQQPHAGPFAGPKPESTMVPRGARRSDQQAHRVCARIPSKLVMRVRFSSPAPSDVPSQGNFRNVAMRLKRSTLVPGHNVGPYFLAIDQPSEPQLFGLRRMRPVIAVVVRFC